VTGGAAIGETGIAIRHYSLLYGQKHKFAVTCT